MPKQLLIQELLFWVCHLSIFSTLLLFGSSSLKMRLVVIRLFALVNSKKMKKIVLTIQKRCSLFKLCLIQKQFLKLNQKDIHFCRKIIAYLALWSFLKIFKKLMIIWMYLLKENNQKKFRRKEHIYWVVYF